MNQAQSGRRTLLSMLLEIAQHAPRPLHARLVFLRNLSKD